MPKHSPWIFNIHHHSHNSHHHRGRIHRQGIGRGGRMDGGDGLVHHHHGGGNRCLGGRTTAGGLMQGRVSNVSGLH